MNLNNRLINEVEDEDIAQEIDRVKDPSSFGALRAILTKMNRLKIELTNMRAQLVESTKRTKELEQKSDNYLTKNKNIAGEIVALKSKVSQLQSQNEFLLNEVEYSQRKVEKQKSQGEVLVARGAPPQPDAYYSHLVRQICQILRIKEEETLIDSIKTIETAYQFLPSLQDTVETIFKIVVEGNIFETPINSYDDLAEAVENWSMNLEDYKNLVEGLIEILNIDEEEKKTVNFILSTINEMAIHLENTPSVQNQITTENDHLVAMLMELTSSNSREVLLDRVAQIANRNEGVENFLEIVRDELGIGEMYSDDAIFSKVVRTLKKKK